MDRQQYRQWREFSLRMVDVCYRASWRPDRAWIRERVGQFIDSFAREYRRIRDWDHIDGDMPVTDHLEDFAYDERPQFDFRFEVPNDPDWEEPEDWPEQCEARAELAREQWDQQWWAPVACCVRAGLDMATRIGGGVVGFTVGDVRRMFPEGVPTYVRLHYPAVLFEQAADHEGIWL